jgi:hypothetical protein
MDSQYYKAMVLPDGSFCTPILTEAEAIKYLRLDVNGPKNPSNTLKYYRDRGMLKAVQIGRNLRYPRLELDKMVSRLIEKQAGK